MKTLETRRPIIGVQFQYGVLLLGDLQAVVVANPILSPLISFVTDVVNQGTSPRIILI